MATQADFERIGNYARMYNKDLNIDRTKEKRTVPLEVLCLGYSRTGTLSMHNALGILGYPNPYHFSSITENVRDSDAWMRAVNAKFYGKGEMPDKAFWDGLLGHVGATTDSPCNLFGRELLEFYPESKVVLVERDIDTWFQSWEHYCESAYNPVLKVFGMLDPFGLGKIGSIGDAITIIQAGFSLTMKEAMVRSKDAYRHHYRDVREYTPKERLLEFKLKDGWGPLCEFLGKPVPVSVPFFTGDKSLIDTLKNVPFPHVNDKEANKQVFAEIGGKAMKRVITNVVAATTLIAVPISAYIWFRRFRR